MCVVFLDVPRVSCGCGLLVKESGSAFGVVRSQGWRWTEWLCGEISGIVCLFVCVRARVRVSEDGKEGGSLGAGVAAVAVWEWLAAESAAGLDVAVHARGPIG